MIQRDEDWRIPFGTHFFGKRIGDLTADQLSTYVTDLDSFYTQSGKEVPPAVKEFCSRVASLEVKPSDFAPRPNDPHGDGIPF
jgi:hypothetical protein